MKLKFLIDESTGRKLNIFLNELGYDSKFSGDIKPRADDKEVLEMANAEKRIIITNDKDFGELIYRQKLSSSGTILLRLRNDNPKTRQEYSVKLIKQLKENLISKFIVLNENKFRMKNLQRKQKELDTVVKESGEIAFNTLICKAMSKLKGKADGKKIVEMLEKLNSKKGLIISYFFKIYFNFYFLP